MDEYFFKKNSLVSFVAVPNFLYSDVIIRIDKLFHDSVSSRHGGHPCDVLKLVMIVNFELCRASMRMTDFNYDRKVRRSQLKII